MMADIDEAARLDRDGDIAVLRFDNPPVNALSRRRREAMDVGRRQAMADDEVRAMVILCEGSTFIAGAELPDVGTIL